MANTVRAQSWFQRFAIAFTLTGGPAVIKQEVMAASQTLLVGDPVTKSSSVISKATASSGALYGFCTGAATTTAADEGTKVPVAVADRNTVFVAQADAATSGIEDGAECDIIASSAAWLVDIGSSTEDVCLIVGRPPEDDESDSTDPGRLYFVVKRSQWDALVAAR